MILNLQRSLLHPRCPPWAPACSSPVTVLRRLLSATASLAAAAADDSSAAASIVNNGSVFALNVRLRIHDAQRAAFLREIRRDQVYTRRDEPRNLQFVVGQDVSDKSVFYLHEQYVNQDAFEEHKQTPHFARYADFCQEQEVFAEEPQVLFFQTMGDEDKPKTKWPVIDDKPLFGVNVNLYPKPERRLDFLKVIQNNQQGTLETEPLALQYTYGESTQDENVFYFHEQYTGNDDVGKEGFDAHAQTPHFAAWEEFVETDPFVQPPQVSLFHILELSEHDAQE